MSSSEQTLKLFSWDPNRKKAKDSYKIYPGLYERKEMHPHFVDIPVHKVVTA